MKTITVAIVIIRAVAMAFFAIVLIPGLFISVIGVLCLAGSFILDLLPCPWGKRDFGLSLAMLSLILETCKPLLVKHWKLFSLAVGVPAGIWGLCEFLGRRLDTGRSSPVATSYPRESTYYPRRTTGTYAQDTTACPRCGRSMSWTGGELNCQVEREYCSHCLF